jgi:hypothetical protein
MKSHGVEFTLSTRNIVTRDFKWNTDFIFSNAKNEVTELDANSRVIDLIAGTGFALEGYPVRSLFSMDFQGLNGQGLPTFINEKGEVAWDAQIISLDELQTRFQEAAKAETKPTVQLRADKESKYDTVAQVMSRASEAGLSDIAFVSEN